MADRNSYENSAVPAEERAQLDRVMGVLHDVLGDALVGAYLFGSAATGELKPHSDLDVMVVSTGRTTQDERRDLIRQLLDVSGKPRFLEVTIVVEGEMKPWSYPPRMDFQYGDWWRDEFERGDLEPWEEVNPDLTTLIEMVRTADTVLQGPPTTDIFEPISQQDLLAAAVKGIAPLLQDLDDDAGNVVLTLARMWSSVTTQEIMSKDAAADWALARLPQEHQGVLAEARAIYLGDKRHESEDFVAKAHRYADHVVAEIQKDSRRQGS